MPAWLRRHLIPIRAHFRHSLVLTYAYPEALMARLLPPGLEPDTYRGLGFLAVALVQTEKLRPAGLPAPLGLDFFLAGYRIFCRFRRPDGGALRGLCILRSDTDRRTMAWAGNLLTHYRYHRVAAESRREGGVLAVRVASADGASDLSLRARVDEPAEAPPPGSPFEDLKVARRFAGPMPFTFGYEPASRRMVVVKGVRERWHPRAVHIESARSAFLERPPFDAVPPRLANAFYLEDIPYRWERGVTFPPLGAA